MKKFTGSKDLFIEQEPGRTFGFHAKPELVKLIEKHYAASDAKSLSFFIAAVLGEVLSDEKPEKKKKIG